MATKDEILGIVPPPIDSSLEGAPKPPVVPTPATLVQQQGNTPPTNNGDAVVPHTEPKQVPTTETVQEPPKQDAPTNTNTGGETQPASVPIQDATANATAPVQQSVPTTDDAGKHLSYVEMFQKMNPYKPPTEEEIAKEKKKQKREAIFAAIGDGVSALANLYFTTKGANNSYDPKTSMSAKMKERWDKLNKEREDGNKEYMSGYLRAMQADDEAARDNRNWKHSLEREGVEDKRFEDNIAHRDKREGVEDKRYDDNIAHRDKRESVEDKHWDRQFKESARQFNVTSSQNAQRIAMEGKRLAHELKSGNGVSFALGAGKGTITVPNNALNGANISYVFNKLPANIKATVQGEAIYDSKKRKVVGYKQPTTDAMLIAIGANIEAAPDAQAALNEIAGKKSKTVGLNNGKGNGKKLGLK